MTKILVAEDDNSIRDILKQMLESQAGYNVRAVSNGDQALAEMKSYRYDLMITDIIMPGKDGIDLIIETRKHNQSLPIIAISGGLRNVKAEFNLDSAKMIGVDEVLQKPFDKFKLLAAVKRLVNA
ncbi:MAG: response regulator [Pseudomonadota bacterium]